METHPAALRGAARTEPVDPAEPRAGCGIGGGRFLAVGSNDDVRGLSKPGLRQIDIGGKALVPGFIDAHTHPSYAGIRQHSYCIRQYTRKDK